MIARLDKARIFHALDVFAVLCPFRRVESQFCVLIFNLERAGVNADLNEAFWQAPPLRRSAIVESEYTLSDAGSG